MFLKENLGPKCFKALLPCKGDLLLNKKKVGSQRVCFLQQSCMKLLNENNLVSDWIGR